MHKTPRYLISVILSVIIMVLAIYVGSTIGNKIHQMDLTEEGLYSLSDGTKAILNKLNTPITLKLYYSKTAAKKGSEGVRFFNNYYDYVKRLLEEYVGHSRNNLKLEFIDPRPDTEDEGDAQLYGLKKFNLSETETYFFGLVARSESGSEKVVEFFDPNRMDMLEYDIVKLIYSVTHPEKKRVGILSSLDVLKSDMSPYIAQIMRMQGKEVSESWIITKLMKEFFEVTKVKKDVSEINGIDILMIVHPRSFSEKLLFAVDQFLLNGGSVLLFIDPHDLSDKNTAMMMRGRGFSSSNLTKLLKTWGVEMKENTFAGDTYLSGYGKMSQFSPPSRLLPILQCNKKCTSNLKDIVTSHLENILMLFPGALTKISKVKNKNLTITPLLTTTAKGNSYKVHPYEMGRPEMISKKFTEGSSPVVLAYRIAGKFDSAFPGGITIEIENEKDKEKKGKDKDKDKDKTKRKHLTGLKKSKKNSAVIVFADVDFLYDHVAFKRSIFGVTKNNDNSTALLNALENLSGSTDLMSIRSKGRIDRGFDVILDIEQQAEKKTADKVSQINKTIKNYQQELRNLGKQANEDNISLLHNKGLLKKKELAKKLAQAKKELRKVKREGREKVEKIGKLFQYLNTLLVPSILLIVGLYSYYLRSNRRKSLRYKRS